MSYTVYVTKGEIMYVATCLENGVVSQGATPQEAIENLKEAVTAYVLVEKSNQEESSQHSFITHFSLPAYA